jgi:hypothetical protein
MTDRSAPAREPLLLRPTAVVLISAGFVCITIALRQILFWTNANLVRFDLPYYWPISVFELNTVTGWTLGAAMFAVLLFAVSVGWLESNAYAPGAVATAGLTLIIATNAVPGVRAGLAAPVAFDARSGVFNPVAADGDQYYHAARDIQSTRVFLREFTELQRQGLNLHARTHPPGAVLLFFVLWKALVHPASIAVAVAAGSVLICVFAFRALLLREVPRRVADYLTFLFLLLPAVQVYYLATLDAVISALLLASVSFFSQGSRMAVAGAACTLFLASALTFAALFAVAVLIAFEVLSRRSLSRATIVIAAVVASWAGVWLLTGFDYGLAFQMATRLENPAGFSGLATPADFVFTRIENVAEILLFLGPFVGVLIVRSVRAALPRSELRVLSGCGVATLLAMFLTGAFRTGETARVCLFIFPFLLLPLAPYLAVRSGNPAERIQLAALVFGQSVAMQAIGFFYW